jgi:sialate O-acetylesterase
MFTRSARNLLIVLALVLCANVALAEGLKVHRVFASNMVIQRDKPIVIWGWADSGKTVTVQFGEQSAEATAADGKWEVTFPAEPANTEPRKLTVTSGDEKVEMDNIVIGDIWVMWGQSNMAWSLGKTINADMELAQANLPLVRGMNISPSETQDELEDLRENAVTPWSMAKDGAAGYSAIGWAFGSQVARATGVPIGIITNARGGASIESLVPEHKFDDHPVAKRYKEHIEQRMADWDVEAWREEAYQKAVARAKSRNVPEEKWPKKESINPRSWNVPGVSPSDMASCYNGMFAPFKKLNIKGVLFHQGYNNAMGSNCRPKRYRVLMKLMVEGIREDFRDPDLAFGVVGFCAGSIAQTDENFEIWDGSTAGYIREAQRLGLADVGTPETTAYITPDDVQIPGLHPQKKREHGVRAARWALGSVYGKKIRWASASVVSSERVDDTIVVTFDKKVMPHNMAVIPVGFSIAGEDGKFYRAYSRYPVTKDVGIWNTANKSYDAKKVIVWSPLVPEPVAVRYNFANNPMGNLYVNGWPHSPLHNFRTDSWDFPESDNPAESAYDRAQGRADGKERQERNTYRRQEEAKRAVEILERLETLGKPTKQAN